MLKQENKDFKRVHKIKARNLFAKGVPIYMMGNKTRLGNMWVSPVPMTKERSFDWNVNNFYAYLAPKLGDDVAYYIRKDIAIPSSKKPVFGEGVIRVQAIDEDDQEAVDEAFDFEIEYAGAPRTEAFLKKMYDNNNLLFSMYVGYAYYVQVKDKRLIGLLAQIMRDELKGKLPPRTKIVVEYNYRPDWAVENTE